MSKKRKTRATGTHDVPRPVSWCEQCKTDTYTSRKVAKQTAQRRWPSRHLAVRECPHQPGYYHLGMLSHRVIAGHDRRSASA